MKPLNETRSKLINSAYAVVAEVGLEGFSMERVTKGAGVSKRLVYKYFDTKEKFLFECFVNVDRQIASKFDEISESLTSDDPTSTNALKQVWIPYFKFMVELGEQALFYYAYRDSSHIREVIEYDAVSSETYFKGFTNYMEKLDLPSTAFASMSEDVLWTYIIDCTGVFAKRMIRGEIPSTDEAVEQIWFLLSHGLSTGR